MNIVPEEGPFATKPVDDIDAAYWDAVEEATEQLHEESYQEALVSLRDVIKTNPQNPYAFYFLGVALFEVGELEAAKGAYEACLRVAPNYLGAKIALSHVCRSLGDARGAVQRGMAALTQAPDDGDALYAVGLAYNARGDRAAARKYLSAFLDQRPEFETATEVRALIESFDAGAPDA